MPVFLCTCACSPRLRSSVRGGGRCLGHGGGSLCLFLLPTFIVWTDHKNLSYLRSARRRILARPGGRCSWAVLTSASPTGPAPGTPSRMPCLASLPFRRGSQVGRPSCPLHVWLERAGGRSRGWSRNHPDPEGCPPNWLYVPLPARSPVLQWGHASKVACYPGFHRTLALLQQSFWWPTVQCPPTPGSSSPPAPSVHTVRPLTALPLVFFAPFLFLTGHGHISLWTSSQACPLPKVTPQS